MLEIVIIIDIPDQLAMGILSPPEKETRSPYFIT